MAATREAKLAFWINAYNAVTVHGILREYPTTSIRNHTAKLFGYNIWHDLQLYVGGTAYSLDTMEHQILRKMSEPRIHFAIVCASIGCPRLLNEAYTADRINEQLEINSKDFFARAQNFRYDQSKKQFYVSAILDWFGEDFGNSQAEQLRRISTMVAQRSGTICGKTKRGQRFLFGIRLEVESAVVDVAERRSVGGWFAAKLLNIVAPDIAAHLGLAHRTQVPGHSGYLLAVASSVLYKRTF